MAKVIPQKNRNPIARVWNALKPSFLSRNSMGDRIPLFNRGSGRGALDLEDLTGLEDADKYKGYLFSAIRTRANRTAQLAADYVKSYVNNVGAEDKESKQPHPYLTVIDQSPSFSNNWFFKALSTFIDLKGVAYVLAVRNFNGEGRYGEVKEFKVINPFATQKLFNNEGDLVGYREFRGGMMRDLPVQMVIEIKELNPFNLGEGFAMVEAAQDDQYLNRQTGKFTRSAIKNNVGQRGLITTEVVLDDQEYENFKSRVNESAGSGNVGKFLFGNGPGSISYTDMQIDLDKLALSAINEISRESLFAVAGVSKTILGMEMSGVTRESGKVQSDLFDRNQTIPQLTLILDGLNQDYRNNYPKEYQKSKLELRIDSPLKTDRDAELLDAKILKTKADTAKVLIETGFADAEVLKAVGLPKMAFEKPDPVIALPPGDIPPEEDEDEEDVENHAHIHDDDPLLKVNELAPALRQVIAGKQSTLITEINNWQGRLLQACLKVVVKNALSDEEQDSVIGKQDAKKAEKDLTEIISQYFLLIIPLFASQTLKARFKEHGLAADFGMNKSIIKFIKDHASLSAKSHMDTVLGEVYATAREAADAGLSRAETVSLLNKTYNKKITKAQATRIARTETNMAIATAQFEADAQFIKQNGLEKRAFKRWLTRSAAPCPFCQELERRTLADPIPFNTNFVNLGDAVTADVKLKDDATVSRSYVVGYEPIGSGTLHPNCSCIYELIIKEES